MAEAKIKAQVYKDPRPAEYFDRFHERARKGRGYAFVYAIVRMILTPPTLIFYRLRARGQERIPETGPVILAANHFSQFDHFFAGVFLRRQIQFMAKSQLFKLPGLTWIFTHGGVFPVRRGYDDQEAFITAERILASNGTVLIYAEGGRSRTGELGEPKRGVGKVALDSGAPVIPVAIYGSAGVRNWTRLRFPKVRVGYGEPITFPAEPNSSHERQQEVADHVFSEVRRLYGDLHRELGHSE